MAELTIRLMTNPATGKKTVIVSLREEDDALPMEHEQLHRQLVDRLIRGGVLRAEELGQLVIERPSATPQEQGETHREPGLPQPSSERRSLSEGATE